ncbi:MAG TPA: DUF4190 domain-containing protein [Lacibacter sp.]|nr:DUF4190 domain-containing protein [Lacibacter sp.]HMO87735.1 DUF4190 domain-containing protein [Lacibacter sp.]HMP86229.1 DUF4190 domain-containing protein [Lacibacter sp.]
MQTCVLSFFAALLLFVVTDGYANGGNSISPAATAAVQAEKNTKKTTAFRQHKAAWEKQLGRKLRWSERVGLRVLLLAGEPDPELQKKANSNAVLGFAFGLGSLLLLPFFAIPGLIFSNKALRAERATPGILEGDKKGLAKAGKILSIIGIVATFILVLYIFLALLLGLAWGFS